MSKRFPIPEFDRDRYKNLEWSAPKLLAKAGEEQLVAAARKGDERAYGCYPVEADPALYDRFQITGSHRHAMLCLTPPRDVRLTGRSWAWEIQRAVVLDSLDPSRASGLFNWKTPRPMDNPLVPRD